MYSWKFDEAFSIINSWGQDRKLEGFILKARLLNHQGEFAKALDEIESAIKISGDLGDKINEFIGAAIQSNILMKLGKMEEVNTLFEKWVIRIKEFDEEMLMNSKWARGFFYNYYAVFKMVNGDIQAPVNIFHKAQKLQKDVDDKHGLAITTHNIGVFYKTIGDFEQALAHHNEAKEYYEKLNYPYGIAMVLSNIGDILRLQGKLIEAKDHMMRAIDIFVQIKGNPNPHIIAFTYRKIGRIHMLLNDLEHARWNFNAAFETVEEGSLPITFVELSFDNILLAIEEGNIEEENKWVQKLRNIQANNPEIKIIEQHLTFIEARILLKSAGRLKDVAEAEKILREIIDEEILSNEITVLAMLQ